ncbi:MAG: membrane protein insertase YidC [Alistipes sp.]|jgi:YidC/Oxa1 family membrane protein insertase|nr:membrane protein insertase YidC [Alistipes sp.]
MDKKTIIGVVLMSLIFIGYVVYNSKQQSEYQAYLNEVQAQEQALAEAEAAAQPTTESTSVTETAEAVIDQATAMYGEQLVAAKAAAEQSVVMKNDYLTVDFTTRGAKMQKVVLAEYTKYAPKDERTEKIVLFDPETAQFDMEFYIKRGLNNVKVNTSEYVFNSEGVRREGDRQVLTMSLEVAPGAKLKYEYVLYDEKNPSRDYLIDFNIKMENLSPIMAQQSSLGLMWSNRTFQNERSYKTENMYTTLSYRLPGEDDVEDLGMSESSVDEQLQSEINWVAFRQQYFSQAFIAHGNFAYADMSFTTEEAGSGYLKHYTSRMGLNYTPQQSEYNFSIYCGPNKYAVLSDVVGPDGESIAMERLIPLGGWLVGWFNRWIVIPVFDFLRNYISSFGIIILILTILVKLLIFPLTYKSYLSSAKMRVIKPEMDALNEKYPRQEDAMKKQQEMMNLYKKAGINPMGGCVPMLIQLPLLWALFRFFPVSIELREQPFLWADDLSAYDSVLNLPFSIPWYGDHVSLFALLMCLTMVGFSYFTYQQQGTANQPGMAGMKFMMVYMMPAMMLFWFNDYASGLCYYYLVSQILTMIIMTSMRHFVDDDKIRYMIEKNSAKRKNSKKSRFQLRYEELMRQQEEMMRQQQKAAGKRK